MSELLQRNRFPMFINISALAILHWEEEQAEDTHRLPRIKRFESCFIRSNAGLLRGWLLMKRTGFRS